MADKKISALTAASTPLAGTEVLPIVQSGATVKVAVSDLTSGRTVAASRLDTSNSDGGGVMATFTSGWSNTLVTIKGDGATGAGVMNISNAAASAALPYQLQLNGTKVLGSDTSGNVDVTIGNLVIGTSGNGVSFAATPGTGTSELLADYEEGTYTPTWNGGTITTVVSAYYTKIGRQVTVIADLILGASASTDVSEITVPFTALSASNWGSGGVAYNTYGATLFVSFDATTNKINFRATANAASLTCVGVATSRFAFTLTYFV